MFKKLKKKLFTFSLIGMLGINILSCGNNNHEEFSNNDLTYTEDNSDIEIDSELEYVFESTTQEQIEEEVVVEQKEEIVIDPKTEVMNLIDSGNIEKVYYALEDTILNIPSYLSEENIEESVILPKLECLEVYQQFDNVCLVKTNEYIGYVNTDTLEELTGNFVVIDISSQELKLYSDNEVIVTSPVVTGKPSTPSDQGLFEIYNISGPRYLVTPEYKTYVDVMMKYNGNEGLHDAEYHTHEDGFTHGWRSLDEFGGDTYLTDGSHGCINMPRDEVMTVKEYVEIGTKVLVKE